MNCIIWQKLERPLQWLVQTPAQWTFLPTVINSILSMSHCSQLAKLLITAISSSSSEKVIKPWHGGSMKRGNWGWPENTTSILGGKKIKVLTFLFVPTWNETETFPKKLGGETETDSRIAQKLGLSDGMWEIQVQIPNLPDPEVHDGISGPKKQLQQERVNCV